MEVWGIRCLRIVAGIMFTHAKVAFSLAFFETITFRLRCPDYMPDAERMRFVELVEQTVGSLLKAEHVWEFLIVEHL